MKDLMRVSMAYRGSRQRPRLRRSARRAAISATITVAAGLFLALPAGPAGASTSVPSPHPAHAATGARVLALNLPYDGTDPIQTGCANSATTPKSVKVYNPSGGAYIGLLQLRWSTSCKTNWGKFTGNGNIGGVSVWVDRQADNQYCGDQSGNGCASPWWPNSAYSNQLYGCNYSTRAEVEIQNGGYYGFTGWASGC